MLVEGKGKPGSLNQGTNTITWMVLKNHFVVRTVIASECSRSRELNWELIGMWGMLAVEVEEG